MTTTTTSIPAAGDRSAPQDFGPLTRTDFVRYQGASGDFVPLHHDELFAQAAGFPTVFSVGMLQAGFLASHASQWFGAANLRRYAMRFREQCWPGDVLTCEGEVTSVESGADGTTLVTVELTCTRQTGGVAITGSADFELPSS